MTPIARLLIVAAGFAAFLGVFSASMRCCRAANAESREICRGAAERGWAYRRLRWQGSPTAFRIDGHTHSGMPWILNSTNAAGYDRGWTTRLGIRFPMLGGETDLFVQPRGEQVRDGMLRGPANSPGLDPRIASISGALASEIAFFRNARELASGAAAFDAAYQVLTLPDRISAPPVDETLAQRMLTWPSAAVAPHSLLFARDWYGLECQARLPSPPNWATVIYFVDLAGDFAARVPHPTKPSAEPRVVDHLLDRFLT